MPETSPQNKISHEYDQDLFREIDHFLIEKGNRLKKLRKRRKLPRIVSLHVVAIFFSEAKVRYGFLYDELHFWLVTPNNAILDIFPLHNDEMGVFASQNPYRDETGEAEDLFNSPEIKKEAELIAKVLRKS